MQKRAMLQRQFAEKHGDGAFTIWFEIQPSQERMMLPAQFNLVSSSLQLACLHLVLECNV